MPELAHLSGPVRNTAIGKLKKLGAADANIALIR